jgi:hypothetical protein
MKLKLESGSTFFVNAEGVKVCTGSQMGRLNIIPACVTAPDALPIKLQMERLRWVDGCYDAGGAYWGRPDSGKNVYCAWGKYGPNDVSVQVFAWALTRKDAKREVREKISNATFFN